MSDAPQILVLNKADRIPANEADAQVLRQRVLGETDASANTPAVLISGLTGAGLPELLTQIDRVLPEEETVLQRFRIPSGSGADIALLHEMGKVLSLEYDDDVCEVQAAVTLPVAKKFSQYRISKSVENDVGN